MPKLTILFLAYFAFWWFYKLDTLPGLHGDEAWVGLKAHRYQTAAIDSLSGMTYYTGIIQSLLAEFSFTLFGTGVFQLRILGAFANFVGLSIIASTLLSRKLYKEAFLFLVMLATSSLYVMSARIAWEVNTFTLFFISMSFVAALNICQEQAKGGAFWIYLLLVSNIFGTYNHVIYSCLSVAGFLGTLLWGSVRGNVIPLKLLSLSGLNFLNVVIVFLFQRYGLELVFKHLALFSFCLVAIVFAEYKIYRRLEHRVANLGFLSQNLKLGIAGVFTLIFAYNHGMGFLDVLSEYKFVLQTYSYECSLAFQALFTVAGIIILFYSLKIILTDLKAKPSITTLFSYVMVSYLGILSFYTTKNSLRYYLVLYAILALYLAFKYSTTTIRAFRAFMLTQLVLLLMINAVFLDVFINDPIPVRATDFTIGNGQLETSSAFLPKQPLINFLRKNHVSKVLYLPYPYFIEQPVRFYQLVTPWKESARDTAAIDYDFHNYGDGFIKIKVK